MSRAETALAAVDGTSETRTERPRVLVVDDEPLLCATLRIGLADEFEVVCAQDAASAMARLRAERFDAVLCDVMLPELGGPALLELLEAQASPLVERIAYMTGGAYTSVTARFVDEVRAPVVEKPFAIAELASLLTRLTAR